MMRYPIWLLLILLCSTPFWACAQQTKSFTISGKVKKESVITIDSLRQYPVKSLDSINITNHAGTFKHKDEGLRGVLLKDVLSHTVFDAAGPKVLSEFYFTCVASDGYKVVYSWNELYNTPVGSQVYVLVEKNGQKIDAMPESILMISMLDFKTGRRYLHNLSKVVVSKVE